MARSTCNPNLEAPEGMMKFKVIRSTVRDSVGQFCVPGDKAILTPQLARYYLDQDYIKVDLPEGFADEVESEQDASDAILHELGHADPKFKGRGAERRAQVAKEREAEAAAAAAAVEAERTRILDAARAEADAIVAAAKESARRGGEPANGVGDEPLSGEGGEADAPVDATGEDTEERSTAEADPVDDTPKRRRRA